jgi:hypothetical protein
MDDDNVERIDLVDDFHANRPATLKPLRVMGGHPASYFIPAGLCGLLNSAELYARSETDRKRQAEVDKKIVKEPTSRLLRFMRTCEFGVRDGKMTDWYFRNNTP